MGTWLYRGDRRAHEELRRRALAAFIEGTPCPQPVAGVVCGQPMYSSQRLELGHDDAGGYLGLVHKVCNARAGAIKGNRNRGRTCRGCGVKFFPSSKRQWLCRKCAPAERIPPTARPW